jgi:hypothetical protein
MSQETDTNFIYWVPLSRFRLKTETESSLRNAVFKIKHRPVLVSRILIVILIYHRHTPTSIDSINLLGS